MSTIAIHTNLTALAAQPQSRPNSLPSLLHTPTGLAILEIQGTINLPSYESDASIPTITIDSNEALQETSIGRLVFPDYQPDTQDPANIAWMKRVYLYVGQHQRLTGEIKKLPKAIAIIRKVPLGGHDSIDDARPAESKTEVLEILEIIKWKILFSQRPEPVGTWDGEAQNKPSAHSNK